MQECHIKNHLLTEKATAILFCCINAMKATNAI